MDDKPSDPLHPFDAQKPSDVTRVRVRFRTWEPSIDTDRWINQGEELSVPLGPYESVAGTTSDGRLLIVQYLEQDRPAIAAVGAERRGRLSVVLPYLDIGERISRETWGCCFMVLSSQPHGEPQVRIYEPSKAAAGVWAELLVQDIRLDTFDLMADDWYVVSHARYERWCLQLGGIPR